MYDRHENMMRRLRNQATAFSPLRKTKMRTKEFAGVGCIVMLVIMCAIFIPMCMWTDRNMDWLLTYIKGVPTNCPWYLSTAITVLLPIAFIGNIVAEICRIAL